MKKVTKVKKNWFKVQFEKHPYLYTFVIGWIILIFINAFLLPILDSKFGYPKGIIRIIFVVPAFIFLLFPLIIFFLWFRKNKSKIKPFFKKRKKIFKPIFYTVGGIISFAVISLIITVITLGGFANFKERAKFEIIVFKERNDACSNPAWKWYAETKFGEFVWKQNTQFIDYFKEKPDKFIKDIISLKNDDLFEFDYCSALRHALKATHKGNQVAKDFLVSAPFVLDTIFITGNESEDEDFLFWKYIKELDENRLNNPAMVNAYAWGLEKADKDKISKIHKQAAEEGYLKGMEDYLWTRYDKEPVDKTECPYILKYVKHLSDEHSLLAWIYLTYGTIGRIDQDGPRVIYECLDKNTDFAKGIELFGVHQKLMKVSKLGSNLASTYPALIYFNGWGNVGKNQELAIELFLKNIEGENPNGISKAYIAFVKLNEQNSENNEDGTKLLNEIINSEVSEYGDPTTIYCDNIKYDFKIPYVKKETDQEEQARKTEYLKPLKSCLNKASSDEKIESVKSYIKSWIENWFKNPELVETLNLFG